MANGKVAPEPPPAMLRLVFLSWKVAPLAGLYPVRFEESWRLMLAPPSAMLLLLLPWASSVCCARSQSDVQARLAVVGAMKPARKRTSGQQQRRQRLPACGAVGAAEQGMCMSKEADVIKNAVCSAK